VSKKKAAHKRQSTKQSASPGDINIGRGICAPHIKKLRQISEKALRYWPTNR